MTRPLCRLCGRPIPKKTETTYFGGGNGPNDRLKDVRPQTRAEAQRHVNGEIVSIRYWGEGARRAIWNVSTWDGESYVSPYFCTGECARRFGYFAMEHPAASTQAYSDALRRQQERAS